MARRALTADPRFRFVRRVITRPGDAGGEDHEALSDTEFARRDFALQWRAHGLRYGIPLDVIDDLARGMVVVANVSRAIIAEAADRFAVQVIEVTAPPHTLAQRLAERGRETAEDVARRLARDVPVPDHIPVYRVTNDGTPQEAADRFIEALIRAV
jgi:phosphonate metabolism protein PhnN/1,5-bisphosphokinase (PRPP-forming)